MPLLCDFLEAFYPDDQEFIHLRSFGPKNAPREPRFSPIKKRVTRSSLSADEGLLQDLHHLNMTRGIYFVVNAGGNQDEDIERFNAFFCENDNLSIKDQIRVLNASPIKPSILVKTLKSVHSYWLIDQSCSAIEWKDVQRRLISYFQSDPAIKNPSRVMRLPYFNHVSFSDTGNLLYQPIELVEFDPNRRYTVQECLGAFPEAHKTITQVGSQNPHGEEISTDGISTWDQLNSALRKRMINHGTCKIEGEWIRLRNGRGNKGIALHIPTGAYRCKAGCTTATVLRAFGLPESPSNGGRTVEGDQHLNQQIQLILQQTGGERNLLIQSLVRNLVYSADTLKLDDVGRTLKNAKVLGLGQWRQLVKEERERQKHQQHESARAQALAERELRFQEQINLECSLETIHRALARTTSSPYSHDVIELVLATSISHLLSDDVLLWLLIVGPPSSDKTQTALSIRNATQVFNLDTLTENAFISGFVSPDGKSPQDLLAELDGYCLTIKDLNSLFGQHPDKIAKVLGDLTAIYDGTFAKWMGTRGNISYDARFSLVGCVTPLTLTRHHRYMSMIGARFLSYRISELNSEAVEEGFDTLWNSNAESKSRLRQLTSAYATQLHHRIKVRGSPLPAFSEQAIRTLNAMARLLACARAAVYTKRTESVTRNGKAAIKYDIVEVQREEPFRALQQLRILALALAFVHQRKEITSHELELCRRVVLSSMPYDRSQILALFQDIDNLNSSGGLSRKTATKKLGVARNQIVRLLTELESIGVLRGEKSRDKGQDNELWIYYPASSEFASIISNPTPPLDHNRDVKKTLLALA